MSPVVGRPLSLVYSSVMRARNWSYDSWLKPSPQFSVPVISIGNLTVGGTGKTPFVDHLLQWCRSQNIVAGVISRGYGGNFSGVKRVDAKDNPEKVGDEPWMLFQRHLQTPIYVCADRVQAARELLIQNPSVNLIIADDAFQHRRLYRDMDIVILDMMESQENYLVLPEGRARESFQGLLRANFVILNKINLAPAEYSLQVKEELKSIDFPEENILESHYHPHQILNVCDRQTF